MKSFCLLLLTLSVALAQKTTTAYVGTYTSGKSEGIYQLLLNHETGALTHLRLAAKTSNPSFLAIHPGGRFLYAVNETGSWKGEKGGGLSAFYISNKDGSLVFLNDRPTQGGAPCHLALDKTGQHVLVANYSGGNTIVFPIDENGELGPASGFNQHQGSSVNPNRQKGPHAHWVDVSPNNQFAFVADLGLDKVLAFRFDSKKGTITPNQPAAVAVKPGAGPRHFAFHPNARFGYVINELNSTLTAFSLHDNQGRLKPMQTVSTLPQNHSGRNSTAELVMHPSGKFIYGSNRGHDSIVVFSVDADSGRLTYVEHEATQGRTPRSFGLDPSGHFLLACNQGSSTIVSFRISQKTGALTPTGHKLKVPTPVCVQFR